MIYFGRGKNLNKIFRAGTTLIVIKGNKTRDDSDKSHTQDPLAGYAAHCPLIWADAFTCPSATCTHPAPICSFGGPQANH